MGAAESCFHVPMTHKDDVVAAREVLVRAGGAMETARLSALVGERAARALPNGGDIAGGPLLTVVRGTADVERVIAQQRGAVVTCLSAAQHHGIPVVGRPPVRVHLAVPRQRGRLRGGPRTEGITVHKETNPITVDPQRPWLADLSTVINRMLLCTEETQAVVAVDHVLNRGLLTPDQIHIPKSGPGTLGARKALARVDGRARSIMETLARLALEDAGIGPIEVGVQIQSVGEVDLLVDGLVVGEIDGRQHSEPDQVAKDRERDLRLKGMGYVVLRFSTLHVRAGMVVPAVRGALARFGSLPRPERVPFTGWRVNAFDQEERLARVVDW